MLSIGASFQMCFDLFRHLIELLGWVISPPVHRTEHHRKTWTNIYALSGIRTHGPSVWEHEAHAPDCVATVTGKKEISR